MCPDCGNKFSVVKVLIFILVLSLGIIAGKATASDSNHKMSAEEKKAMSRKALSSKEKEEIVSVLEANEELHAAFFKYDAKEVEKGASKVLALVSKLNNEELVKLLKFSKIKLADIKAENSRDENNKNYHLVSMALIYVINKFDVGEQYNAYSCPMVKMKWVQNSKKLAKLSNPYAPDMPHCGSQDSHYGH